MNDTAIEFSGAMGVDLAPDQAMRRFKYATFGRLHGVSCLGPAWHTPSNRVAESIAYMKQNITQPLRMATLAAAVKISLPHYFALFKRHTGDTPLAYFTQLRIQRASQLLKSTALSVQEVAVTLGYDDPFYFSRVFKSVKGLSPTKYRMARPCRHELGGTPNQDAAQTRSPKRPSLGQIGKIARPGLPLKNRTSDC